MKKWILLLPALLTLWGCCNINTEQPGRPVVVTRIQASYHSSAISLQRNYTDEEKMLALLTYLRCLEPYGIAQPDPAADPGPRAHIRLYYSDGTFKDYIQQADLYLQVNGGPWQNIPGERAREFPLLLGLMESDPSDTDRDEDPPQSD